MIYRRLGQCGLKVGAFSLGAGNWGSGRMDEAAVREILAAAMDSGVIYFDNAESYSDGAAELVMGRALKSLGWSRVKYVVSTKFFWGLGKGPNQKNTLNRKYLLHGMEQALKRTQLDYIDLVYCHRPDPHTPIEETVWALHNIIERGWALYWGTSEWSAAQIRDAIEIADRHHLHRPVVEQPEYNLLHRRRVEAECVPLSHETGLGLAVWSPLAGGILTGKYLERVAPDTRAAAMAGLKDLGKSLTDPQRLQIVRSLAQTASDAGMPLAHLALAWCLRRPEVSTCILGASSIAQLSDNVQALDLLPKLDAGLLARIDAAVGGYSESWVGSSPWHYED
jgi:voltage-dependent potassium channel beta subunit